MTSLILPYVTHISAFVRYRLYYVRIGNWSERPV